MSGNVTGDITLQYTELYSKRDVLASADSGSLVGLLPVNRWLNRS